jgi:hypothetical protein
MYSAGEQLRYFNELLLDESPMVEDLESAAFVVESFEHPAQKIAAETRMILFRNMRIFIDFPFSVL